MIFDNWVRLPLILIFLAWNTAISGQCVEYEYADIFQASWLSCTSSGHPVLTTPTNWIEYDLKLPRKLASTHIWNYNIPGETESGINEIDIFYSIDSTEWTFLGTDTIEEANGSLNFPGEQSLDFEGASARFILLSANSNHGGSCTGFSEIQINVDEDICSLKSADIDFAWELCEDTLSVITIIPNGGIAPYRYFWSNGDTVDTGYDLSTGTYEVVVIDSLNCSIMFELSITNKSDITLNIDENPISPGTYLGYNLKSSGVLKNEPGALFLYINETVINPSFEVNFDSELIISRISCAEDSSKQKISMMFEKEVTLPLYRNYIGNGNDGDIEVNSSSDLTSAKDEYTLSGLGNVDELSASRFLGQATLGYDRQMIDQVRDIGFEQWIEYQCDLEPEEYVEHLKKIMRFGTQVNYWLNFHRTWWHNVLTGYNYLREKITLALSEILVTSSNSFLLNYGDGLTSYYDMLSANAFGNYRDLLHDVTMHPVMGFYLSHLNNPKSDTTLNQFPDENYAREFLQLFSIGLFELNLDGTHKLDSVGNSIPTYDNNDIVEFAKVFTGLGFAGRSFGTDPSALLGLPYTSPMVMNESFHEGGEKELLDGYIIPSGQTGLDDINDALDNIFNHPNVGPFVATRLIQRLVKSEPSPEYVERVATAFNNNGEGVRGDLKAVIKAILLDDEARNCAFLTDEKHGMLKEPFTRYIHLLKAFNISSNQNTFYALGSQLENLNFQAPLRAPSVFNFFEPGFIPSGILGDSSIRSPEFQIFDSYSSIGYLNLVDSVSMDSMVLDVEEGMVSLDFSEELALSDNSADLVDHLDKKLTYGNLSSTTRNIIVNAIDGLALPEEKVRMAIFLLATSPDYAILK